MSRLDRVNANLLIAQVIAQRSTCNRAQVGCVIVDGVNRIKGVGYNGNPSGAPHCIDSDCFVMDGHCVTTTHAEINAIQGLGLGCYTAYCTHSPCLTCLKVGVNVGVMSWVYLTHYEDKYTREFIRWYNNNRETWQGRIIKLTQVELNENSYSVVG